MVAEVQVQGVGHLRAAVRQPNNNAEGQKAAEEGRRQDKVNKK